MSILDLASNLVLYDVEFDIHFISEKVLSHQLHVQHIPTSEQPVNALTNPSLLISFCL